MDEYNFDNLAALIFAFKINERSAWVFIEEINQWHGLVNALSNLMSEDFSAFRIPDEAIKAETRQLETARSRQNPFRGATGQYQYETAYTGRRYCERHIFLSKRDGLQAALLLRLTPPEQEIAKKAKIGF